MPLPAPLEGTSARPPTCSRDRFGEPMRPFHREIDVVRAPDDEGRRPQRTELRLDLARVPVIERHDEPLEVARALIGSRQWAKIRLNTFVRDRFRPFVSWPKRSRRTK